MGSFNQILDENATCRDIFEYFFDLSPSDINVLYSLETGKPEPVDDIAMRLKKDRTTVFRSLQRLVGSGLVSKRKQCMQKGGYYYSYSRISPEKISDVVNKKEKEFHMVLQCLLKDIDHEFKA
jgi:predicted transcriptional regulator